MTPRRAACDEWHVCLGTGRDKISKEQHLPPPSIQELSSPRLVECFVVGRAPCLCAWPVAVVGAFAHEKEDVQGIGSNMDMDIYLPCY